MKPGLRRLVALVVTLALASAAVACGSPAPRTTQAAAPAAARQYRVPGEYLVTVAARDRVAAIADLYGQFGIKELRDLGGTVFLLRVTEDPGPARMEQVRAGSAHILAIQPNLVYGTRRPGSVP
ncbi:MAG TPA: hypothetical protein VFS80_11790 [Burkholderiales bacterium]|nr:hypothetical protein [Burkholderiales bacterium]